MKKSISHTILKLALFLSLTLSVGDLQAEYILSQNCQHALQEILSLRTTTARKILSLEKIENPNNYYAMYLEYYCDVMDMLMLEDEYLYEEFKDKYYARREIMDGKDEDSPFYTLVESEMLFYLGIGHLKFGSKLKGARKVYKAYRLLQDNIEAHPHFWFNEKWQASYMMLFANIPPNIRWATNMLGMRGDLEDGFLLLKEYAEKAQTIPGIAEESVLFMNLAYKFTWDEEGGMAYFSTLPEEMRECLLINYFYANQAAFSGHNDLALDIVASLDKDKMEVPFYALDYVSGRWMLNGLRPEANNYLTTYIREFPGKDYKKDACLRLSWYSLLQGDTTAYEAYYGKISTIGDDLRDRDREAAKEAQLTYIPNIKLLTARLLFDGGYYSQSLDTLMKINPEDLQLLPYRLEYQYRFGRIYQCMDQLEEAQQWFQTTIQMGRDEPYTFATRSAYQLGRVYESMGEYEKAIEYYELCEDLFDSDHTVAELDNKAEVAIKRLKKKI